MKTLAEIEMAADALPWDDQRKLVRYLSTRLGFRAADAESATVLPPEGHSVLDIEPVRLGGVVQPLRQGEDLLGEMLEGRV